MIIVHKRPQISDERQPELLAKEEKLAVTVEEVTRIYDLSGFEIGQYLKEPEGYLMAVWREEDGVHVDILWPIGENTSEEEKNPQPETLKDTSKLPSGTKVGLAFAWPQKPEVSTETQLVVGLMQGLLASGVNVVSDELILKTTEVFTFPEFAFAVTYKKGEIVQEGGLFYAVIADHTSNEAYPIETTFAYYRLIDLMATGNQDDPIPYPETEGTVANVENGKYYSYKGNVYLAKADMSNCVWPPDSGIWQWEVVVK